VDDEVIWLMVLAAFLGRHGYRTAVARDGHEAMERAAAERPDAIVLDLSMPRMDGFEFLRLLRATPGLSDVPVVVSTARADARTAERVGPLGVRHYLVKATHSMSELLDAVRESLPPPPTGLAA
jgi:chemosensory pili system protein ChpA (sensor histidine kinase/response regulator)